MRTGHSRTLAVEAPRAPARESFSGPSCERFSQKGRPAGFGRIVFLRHLLPTILFYGVSFLAILVTQNLWVGFAMLTLLTLVDVVPALDKDRRCMHDHMAKTLVVTPK